jgi:hypothetical protein
MRIEGTLAIARAAAMGSLASFTRGDIHLGPPGSTGIVIDLSDHSVNARSSVSMNWYADEDRLAIDELAIVVPLGIFAARVMDEMVQAQGAASATELVRADSGCEQFALWVDERAEIAAECDEACVLASCTNAIDGVLSVARVALGSLDDARHRIHLSGAVLCRDADGNLGADTLPRVTLSGTWSNPSDTSSMAVETSFEGSRVMPTL